MKLKIKYIIIAVSVFIFMLLAGCTASDRYTDDIYVRSVDISEKAILGGENIVRTANYVIAGQDSPDYIKTQADYRCDGTADNIEFQDALNNLPITGGLIEFFGNLVFADQPARAIPNVKIKGHGMSCRISWNASNSLISAGNQSGWEFENFDTDAGWIDISTAVRPIIKNVTINNVSVVPEPPGDTDVYFHKSRANSRYYAMDCHSGEILIEGASSSAGCKACLERGLEWVHVNTKVRAGGTGGYYLDNLTIDGKVFNDVGNPAAEDRGLYEIILDFSSIEFVKTGNADENFITIESMLGCEVYFGIITGHVHASYSLLNIKPTIAGAYPAIAGSPMFNYNKIRVQHLCHSDCPGTALKLDATVASINENVFEIQSLNGAFGRGISIPDPQPKDANFNCFNLGYLKANYDATSRGIDLLGGSMGRSTYNIGLFDAQGTAGGIVSPYADNNIYIIGDLVADANEGIQFGVSSNYNTVISSGTLGTNGWTDAGTRNRFIIPNIKNSGNAQIAAGENSTVVNHGLGKIPTRVKFTPTSDPGIGAATTFYWWIDTKTATQFTIHTNINVVNIYTGDWEVSIGEGN
jgi:hypothetical protein